MKRHNPPNRRTEGFTIIELLVATAVFATVLIVVTTGILQFSRVYYRGVTEANTQTAARTVVDLISQSIQFNGGAVSNTPGAVVAGNSYDFCVGSSEYSYRPGYKLVDKTPGTNETNHSLVVRQVSGCTGPTGGQDLSSASVTGRELLSPNMRLANVTVTNVSGDLYKVQVRVVFGDDDLLNNPTTATASCKGNAGSQFCAVSELSTMVVKRVE